MKHFCIAVIALLFSQLLSAQVPQGPPVNPLAGVFAVEWTTYLGGTDTDEMLAIADMPDGGVVVCGRTMSLNFPGADSLDTLMGSYDMVIVRFDSSGQVMWSTLYGGQFYESANALIVADTSIYVVGASNGTDCPMINAAQPLSGGSYDAIILRVGFDGTVQQSSHFGGFGAELGYGIAIDSTGNIIIGGSSTSTTIPQCGVGYQPTNGGGNDCFIALLNSSFAPQWSTFYGGNSSEDVHKLCVTPLNKIVLIGASFSPNFPCTPNAFQPGRLGTCDAYYVMFDVTGNRLYATYYGGSGQEDCFGIAGDSAGNIYLGGHTSSMDFNTAGTIFQPMFAGVNDAWLARFDSTGQPVFSTFFGGAMDDKAEGMFLKFGHLFLCGVSQSTDLPMNTNVPQDSMWGASDGYVVKFDTAGNYVTSSYLGGNGADDMYSVTVNDDTMLTGCGVTYSNNLATTPGCYQPMYSSVGDGFVVRYKLSETWTPSAVEQPEQSGGVSIYPNPNNGTFLINAVSEMERVLIYDLQGRIVYASNEIHAPSVRCDFESAPGVYVVEVMLSDGSQIRSQIVRAQ